MSSILSTLAFIAYLVGSTYVYEEDLTVCTYRTMDHKYYSQQWLGKVDCPEVLQVNE